MVHELEDPKVINRNAFVIVLGFLTLASLTMGFFGLQQRVAAGWPTTQAIIESAVRENAPDLPNSEGGLDRSHIKVVYRYSVNGQQYRTEEIAAALIKLSEAERYLKKYPKDSSVEIHYNPKAPQESQLASVSQNAMKFLCVSIALGAVVLFSILIRMYLERKNAKLSD